MRPWSIEVDTALVEFTLLGVGFCDGNFKRPVPLRLGSPPKGGIPPPPAGFAGVVPKSFCNKKLITANMMIPLLQGSEDGIELYESFLKLIDQMGIDDFLTLQV